MRNLEEAQKCDAPSYSHLFRTLFQQGIYIPPSQYEAWFISQAHREEHLEKTKKAILAFLDQDKIE